jgi:acyl-CoA reductase-like NAD-dependent aldehyde dehydrogenase
VSFVRSTRPSSGPAIRRTGCRRPSSRELAIARRYLDAIETGLAHVNVHTGYKEPSMPFGGMNQSGAGLPPNSRSGLEFFVDRQAVYLRP